MAVATSSNMRQLASSHQRLQDLDALRAGASIDLAAR